MIRKIASFAQSVFAGAGAVWLVVGLWSEYGSVENPSFEFVLGLGLISGAILALGWRGITFFLSRCPVELYFKESDTTITVMFGDIFRQPGCKAIAVNDFFDSLVDGDHVSENSLHGVMLSIYWPANVGDWDDQIANDLQGVAVETVIRATKGKDRRYPIGTTACASKNGDKFLCVALGRTNVTNRQVHSSSDDLQHAVRGLLEKARSECSGNDLNIPLLGSKLAKTGLTPQTIIYLILLAVREESKNCKIADKIRLVLPKDKRHRIDLESIKRDWN